MRTLRVLATVLAACVAGAAAQTGAPLADHVLVIGIDGLGAEGLRASTSPTLHGLMSNGASTLTARGVIPTVSSPNWASMIMGAGPERHGVTSNDWEPNKHEIEPVVTGPGGIFPTMFGVLRAIRPDAVIGIVHEWDGFARLVEPGAPTLVEHGVDGVKTVEIAARFIREKKPALMFVHLDLVDHAGHSSGWMTADYMAALGDADALVGRLLTAADEAGIRARTLVLVSADHGGVGTRHGGLTMSEIEIPWIASGAGVKRGHAITTPVATIDTAPTVLHALGVSQPAAWVGRPVLDALDR